MGLPIEKLSLSSLHEYLTPLTTKQEERLKNTLGCGVYTNRLHHVSQSRLAIIKALTQKIERELPQIIENPALAELAKSKLENILNYSSSIQDGVIPDMIALEILCSDHFHALESALINYREQVEDLEAGIIGRVNKKIKFLAKKIRKKISAKDNVQHQPAEIPIDQFIHIKATLNNFSNVDNSDTAFELFPKWYSVFHYRGQRYGSNQPRVSDIAQSYIDADQFLHFKGKRVIELGCLEAAHTKELVDLGAAEVVAIEANQEAFLKSLIVKNEFNLNNVTFIYGDCLKILSKAEFRAEHKFDICIASGILYHMEDPLLFIDLITQSAPELYIWTQVASETSPKGPWVELKDTELRSYRARRNEYKNEPHLGGVGSGAHWLTKEDLYRAINDRGFDLIFKQDDQSPFGESVTLLARRR